MARRKKLSIILPRENVATAAVITYAKGVENGMTTNAATFPTPPVTMAALGAAITAAENAQVPESDRSSNTDAVLAQKKQDLLDLLLPLSNYVLSVANGDRFVAGLSDFELSKEETTNNPPGQFSASFLRPGPTDGTAEVRIGARAGNALFIVMLKVGDAWVMLDAFNTLQFTVEGLPSGTSTLRIYGKKGQLRSPAVEIVVKAV